jgi:hypothetical protein
MLRLSEQIRSTHNQDGAVILDVRHGQMFRLNSVGSRMLEFLMQGYSEARIADEISRKLNVDVETIRMDVHEFLLQLEEHHLLESRQENDR